MFNYILFDLDGTLTDPKEGITKSVQYALENFGIHETDEATLLKFIGPPLYDSFKELYGFSHDDANAAVSKYRERFSSVGILENKLLGGACDILKALKDNGKTVVLASSKPQPFVEKILKNFNIDCYFDLVVGALFDGTRSYKHEVIDEVLLDLKPVSLDEVVMVGDRKQDITGAKKCGIASIGLRCGYAEPDELETAGADYIFSNLFELKDFLLK